MRLESLRKREHNLLTNKQKIRYWATGIIPEGRKINPQYFIEKMVNDNACLHTENQHELVETDFSEEVPDEIENAQKSANRLFIYFKNKLNTEQQDSIRKSVSESIVKLCSQQMNVKVQKNIKNVNSSKVNPGQLMTKIYEQTQKLCQIKEHRMSRITKQIQKLYKESHEKYIELMKSKSMNGFYHSCHSVQQISENQNLGENTNKQQTLAHTETDLSASPKKKADVSNGQQQNYEQFKLSKQIAQIKKRINEKQNQLQTLTTSKKMLEEEKSMFVKLLLKNGYYRSDGIMWMLTILAKNNQVLNIHHLNDQLNDKIKDLILFQYDEIVQELNDSQTIQRVRRQTLHQSIESKKNSLQAGGIDLSKAPSSLLQIPQTESRKRIYSMTQNYIGQWLRKQKWRVNPLLSSQKKPQFVLESPLKKKRAERLKKLRFSTTPQEYNWIIEYVFGNEKLTNTSTLVNLSICNSKSYGYTSSTNSGQVPKKGARKQSYNSNASHNNSQNSNAEQLRHSQLSAQGTGRSNKSVRVSSHHRIKQIQIK